MIAVGIDVSKSKSTVAILNADGSIRAKSFEIHHNLDEFISYSRLALWPNFAFPNTFFLLHLQILHI